MGNHIGINLWNWDLTDRRVLPELIGRIVEMGYTSVEIPCLGYTAAETAAISQAVQAHGLHATVCAAMTAGRDFASDDPHETANARRYLSDCLRFAAACGATLLCGPLYAGGGHRVYLSEADKRAELERAANRLRDMADEARSLNLRLAIEPINRYRTSVVNTVAQALELVRLMGRPNAGLLYDTYQANIEEADPALALRNALDSGRLFHFHASDSNRRVPGQGHVDWDQTFDTLRSGDYRAAVTIEVFHYGSMDSGFIPTGNPDDNARAGLRYLREKLG